MRRGHDHTLWDVNSDQGFWFKWNVLGSEMSNGADKKYQDAFTMDAKGRIILENNSILIYLHTVTFGKLAPPLHRSQD